MSTIDTLNTVQQQLAKVTTGTSSSSTLSSDTFSKALDFAMESKSLVLPTPINTAIDLGINAFDIKELITSGDSALEEGIEDVFSDLSVGIASSFVAALSGEDSATAITSITSEESTTETVTTGSTEQSSQLNIQSTSEVETMGHGVVPLVADKDPAPLVSTLLSKLESILLDDEKEDEKS